MNSGKIKKILKKVRSQKDMSIFELAKTMNTGFKNADQKHDDLAGMVARGFTELRQDTSEGFERTDGHINMVEHKVDRVQDSVNELSYESRKTRTRIENLEFKVFGSIQEP